MKDISTSKSCYEAAPPGVSLEKLHGFLIVIEGQDSSGRTTQANLLTEWLEQKGYAVARAGLKRSKLVAPELDKAQQGNVLSPRTMSLFYATDFYDQLENTIVPALQAGYIVLADRYVYTLMARDLARGANLKWVTSLYSRAIVPDAIYFLVSSPANLAERTLSAKHSMDYWESGMDMGISRDWFESFVKYQRRLRTEYNRLKEAFGLEMVNANRSISAVQKELRARIAMVLKEYNRT